MGFGAAGAQDVQNFDAMGDQGVGDEPAVAAPGHGFGAEDGGGGLGGAPDEPLQGGGEFRGFHVVGVAAERFDPPGGMLGVGTGGAPAAEVWLVDVPDAGPVEGGGQGIARELRVTPGAGIAPDVHEHLDAVLGQQVEELSDGTG